MDPLDNYRYGGARALVMLHEQQLTKFLATWKTAHVAGVVIPATDDPNYASLESVLWHVLACAGSYMSWMCKVLELPDPEIRPAPEVEVIADQADDYLSHLIERWLTPLAEVSEDSFYHPEYTSAWNVAYCIDAMLEHAVMHPLRHRFQLEQWLLLQGKVDQ